MGPRVPHSVGRATLHSGDEAALGAHPVQQQPPAVRPNELLAGPSTAVWTGHTDVSCRPSPCTGRCSMCELCTEHCTFYFCSDADAPAGLWSSG
eukprot:1886328-Pleurochrysis_carterae.AAC.1